MAWRQAIIWTNADKIHLHIYAALGGYELIHFAVIWTSYQFQTTQS